MVLPPKKQLSAEADALRIPYIEKSVNVFSNNSERLSAGYGKSDKKCRKLRTKKITHKK